jgi:hypothetical protein
VVYNEFSLSEDFKDEWRRYIPNIPYSPEVTTVHGIALVTAKDIPLMQGDKPIELLAAYFTFNS